MTQVLDCAYLSGAVYADGQRWEAKAIRRGWSALGIERNEGARGFYGKAFRHRDGAVLVGFRGTDDGLDVWDDLSFGLGRVPQRQALLAIDVVGKTIRATGQRPICTGHSLGGGLAKIVASKLHGVWGIGFNAPGVVGLQWAGGLTERIRSYNLTGDLVSEVGHTAGETVIPGPPMRRSPLGYLSPAFAVGSALAHAFRAHGIDTVIRALEGSEIGRRPVGD